LAVLFGILMVGAIVLELTNSTFTRLGFSLAPTACVAVLGISCFPSWRSRRRTTSRASTPVSEVDPIEYDLVEAAGADGLGCGGDILDGRVAYPEFLFPAIQARLLTVPSGESFLVARFESVEEAMEAARGYMTFFGMAGLEHGDRGLQGWNWKGPRPQARDFAWMRREGGLLRVWTARDRRRLDAMACFRKGRAGQLKGSASAREDVGRNGNAVWSR